MTDLHTWTDMELVKLQAELRKYPEDREQLDEVLRELGRREKGKVNDGTGRTLH